MVEENKILNKKEQIEIIIKATKEFNKITNKLLKMGIDITETFEGIYDIAYDVIPGILGVEVDYNNDSIYGQLCDLVWKVTYGHITTTQYFKKIETLLPKD